MTAADRSNGTTSFSRKRESSRRWWWWCPVILAQAGIQLAAVAVPRHSRASGNSAGGGAPSFSRKRESSRWRWWRCVPSFSRKRESSRRRWWCVPSFSRNHTLLPALIALLSACYQEPREPTYSPKTAAVTAYNAAESALKSGDTATALIQAQSAYNADPRFDAAAWLFASLLGRAGDFPGALEVANALTVRSPDFVQAHLLQGILWDRTGDSEAANRSYDRALQLIAAMPEAKRERPSEQLHEALTLYLRHGELEGVKALNRFLTRFPEHPTALYLKACMQEKNRDFLLRWFSESGGDDHLPATQPETPEKNSSGE